MIDTQEDILKLSLARKRLVELSLKSPAEIPQLDDPNEEQKERIDRRMHGSARSWEAFNNNG